MARHNWSTTHWTCVAEVDRRMINDATAEGMSWNTAARAKKIMASFRPRHGTALDSIDQTVRLYGERATGDRHDPREQTPKLRNGDDDSKGQLRRHAKEQQQHHHIIIA
mmetsp:Transcript_8136/g.11762  ORF Transcript_8136/g.11762 Transcript_8136/m.11762 type:complete len:109 (-) Transcript_8136:1801-2127(-)